MVRLALARRCSALLACAAFAAPILAAAASAQGIRLNPPLARTSASDVAQHRLDPSGGRAVFTLDSNLDGNRDLYSVVPGSPAQVLDLAHGVIALDLTADGSTVVYSASTSGVGALLAVPAAGGLPVTLCTTVGGGAIQGFAIAPDASRVAFWGDARVDGVRELFSVPLDGSAPPAVLSRGPVTVVTARFAPDSSVLVYVESLGSQHAFSRAPADGSSDPVQLGAPATYDALAFEITPDSSRVVFVRSWPSAAVLVAPLDAPGPTVSVSGARVPTPRFALTADGATVVFCESGGQLWTASVLGGGAPAFLAAHRFGGSFDWQLDGPTGRVLFAPQDFAPPRVFSIPVTGGPATLLCDVGEPFQCVPAPGGLVVVTTDVIPTNSWTFAFLVVPIDGSAPPVEVGRTLSGKQFIDSQVVPGYVLYHDRNPAGAYELVAAPLDGGAPATRLHPELPIDRQVLPTLGWSADGAYVAFASDLSEDEAFDLFLSPTDASAPPLRLNPDLPLGPVVGDVVEARFSPDGRHVIYRADQDVNDVVELHHVALARPRRSERLNGTLVVGGDVLQFAVGPERVVYAATEESPTRQQLYSAPWSGGAPSQEIGGGIFLRGGFRLSGDGARAVFKNDDVVSSALELWSTASDGSAPPVLLSAPGSSGDYVLSPLSDVAAVVANFDGDSTQELAVVPLAGGALSVLVDTVQPPRDVSFGPDGARLLFRSGPEQSGGWGASPLYSVALAGGAPVMVSQPMPPLSTTYGGAFTPSAADVLYLADANTNELYQLFRAPAAGGGPQVALSSVSTSAFELSPDGGRVAFLANGSLRAAPTDGSAAPTLLSAGVAREPLELTPDGSRVLFLLEQQTRLALMSVPSDGSAPPIQLCRVGANVASDFRLMPDGLSVVFREDGSRDALMLARVDGSGPLLRLSRASAFNVSSFEIAPDGSGVLFVGDLDRQGVMELYWTPLEGRWRPGALGR